MGEKPMYVVVGNAVHVYRDLEEVVRAVYVNKWLRRTNGLICTETIPNRNGKGSGPKDGSVIGRFAFGRVYLDGDEDRPIEVPLEVQTQVARRAKARKAATVRSIPRRIVGLLVAAVSGVVISIYFFAHGDSRSYAGDELIAWILGVVFLGGLAAAF